MSEPAKRVDMVCERCGSLDVWAGACVTWNTEEQEWDLDSLDGEEFCNDCQQKCNIKQKEIK